MIGSILSKIGMPILVSVLEKALERLDSKPAQIAAKALSDVRGAIDDGVMKADDITHANHFILSMREIETEEFQTLITQVNESLRTEVQSEDRYVRRMRPTFGYIMAMTWAAQMFAIAYVIITNPAVSGQVISAMASLGTIWTVGLSVLGIYVYKRSQEKTINQSSNTSPNSSSNIQAILDLFLNNKA